MDIEVERAYPTPFANSHLLPLLLLSLATQRNAPKQSSTFNKEYDYIVVGGGSAGSVVASRLSEASCKTVLLLEAGAVEPPLLNDLPSIARSFWFTDLDWQFKTVPQKNTAKALINRQVIWPSGKGLGGSSLLNAMLFMRGNRRDYDDWEAQGAEGWSFKDVWPYFVKLEDDRNLRYLMNGQHAVGGPISVEKPGYEAEIRNPILEAAQQLGYKVIDSNAETQTGFYDFQATVRNGQRCSTAKAYLVSVENNTNLDIVGGAYVKKILLERSRAVGVLFDYKNSEYQVRAREEVIVSAGTTNSAQLLILSGIGPREHLEELNIPVVADLPVGNNFQDHCGALVTFQLNSSIPKVTEKLLNPRNIKEYTKNRTGPLASLEFISALAFLNSQSVHPDEDFPDYELYFVELPKEIPEHQIGLLPEIYRKVFGPYEKIPMYTCVSQLLHPKSRGTVRLQSTNPYDPPLIDPNYFDDPQDIDIIVKGMKKCLQIGTSKPMQKVGSKPLSVVFPGCEDLVSDVDKYSACLARSVILTLSHQVGTAKMGDPRDPTTVVDPLLRVKGIKGLRVVDASVMPTVPSGSTNIPTIMIAEKASDIIKESARCGENELPNYDYEPDFSDNYKSYEYWYYGN